METPYATRRKVIAVSLAATAALGVGGYIENKTNFLWNDMAACIELRPGGQTQDQVSSYDTALADWQLGATPLMDINGNLMISVANQQAAEQANNILSRGGKPYTCVPVGGGLLQRDLTNGGTMTITGVPEVVDGLPTGKIVVDYSAQGGYTVVDTPD